VCYNNVNTTRGVAACRLVHGELTSARLTYRHIQGVAAEASEAACNKNCKGPRTFVQVTKNITRNTHAHLCLAPVHRLHARVIYMGAGEVHVARITFVKLL